MIQVLKTKRQNRETSIFLELYVFNVRTLQLWLFVSAGGGRDASCGILSFGVTQVDEKGRQVNQVSYRSACTEEPSYAG